MLLQLTLLLLGRTWIGFLGTVECLGEQIEGLDEKYATYDYVDSKFALSGDSYLKEETYSKEEVDAKFDGYATEQWVQDQGYLTQVDVDGFATEQYVDDKIGEISASTSGSITTIKEYIDNTVTIISGNIENITNEITVLSGAIDTEIERATTKEQEILDEIGLLKQKDVSLDEKDAELEAAIALKADDTKVNDVINEVTRHEQALANLQDKDVEIVASIEALSAESKSTDEALSGAIDTVKASVVALDEAKQDKGDYVTQHVFDNTIAFYIKEVDADAKYQPKGDYQPRGNYLTEVPSDYVKYPYVNSAVETARQSAVNESKVYADSLYNRCTAETLEKLNLKADKSYVENYYVTKADLDSRGYMTQVDMDSLVNMVETRIWVGSDHHQGLEEINRQLVARIVQLENELDALENEVHTAFGEFSPQQVRQILESVGIH